MIIAFYTKIHISSFEMDLDFEDYLSAGEASYFIIYIFIKPKNGNNNIVNSEPCRM